MGTHANIRHICLTGFMGSGKSTIGRKLAAYMQFPFLDTDARIESRLGLSVKEIFARKGEEFFRKEEAEQIRCDLESPGVKIISLGGGALMHRPNQEKVREKTLLIYIYSRPERIYQRIRHSTKRPLYRADNEMMTEEESLLRIVDLMEKRAEGYNLADIVFDRDQLNAEEAAKKLFELIQSDYSELLKSTG